MLEAHDLGLRHLAGVVDRGVAVGVDQQLVALARQGRDQAEIGLVAGREDHAVLLAVELGDLLLERRVLGVAAVGDARAGRAGAFGADRLDGGVHAALVEGQAEIVVGADQQGLAAVDDRFGRRQDPFHADLERIVSGGPNVPIGLEQALHTDRTGPWLTPGAELLDGVGELVDGVDLGHDVHGDRDVEVILELHDHVHDGERIDGQILGDHRARP